MYDPNSAPDNVRRALLGLLPLLALPELVVAQDPVQMQPQSYRVVLENDKLRVLEFNSRPGMGVCGNGMHSHPAHLSVLLSAAGKIRVRTPDNKIEEVPAMAPGYVFWMEPVTHETENITGADIRSLLIELKSCRA
jgi:quercetin dioxygenase-like cupin family protein